MPLVPINARDFTAVVPDGPVNRHAQVVLYLDTDTGNVKGEPALDVARAEAVGRDGKLPVEQLVGAPGADAGELDKLRDEVKSLRAQLDAQHEQNGGGTDA